MNQTDVNKVLGRLDVTASEQEFEADKPGLISILIKNPFDLPIEILELVGPRSPHLQDQDGTLEASRKFYRSPWNNFLMKLGLLSPMAFENVRLAFAHPKGEAIERVEPHCDTVMYVLVSTRNWMLFKPTVMKLTPRLKYRVDGVEKTQGVSNAYLSQIELGRVGPPSPKIIERLADALGHPYVKLMSLAGYLNHPTWCIDDKEEI